VDARLCDVRESSPRAQKAARSARVASPCPRGYGFRAQGADEDLTYSPSRRSAPFGETEKERQGRPGAWFHRDAKRGLFGIVGRGDWDECRFGESVMPALVAGIHVFAELQRCKDVDGRDKPGHDVENGRRPCRPITRNPSRTNPAAPRCARCSRRTTSQSSGRHARREKSGTRSSTT
jgi:hypothetical protein